MCRRTKIEATWVAVGANNWIVAGDGRSTEKSANFGREEEAIGCDGCRRAQGRIGCMPMEGSCHVECEAQWNVSVIESMNKTIDGIDAREECEERRECVPATEEDRHGCNECRLTNKRGRRRHRRQRSVLTNE